MTVEAGEVLAAIDGAQVGVFSYVMRSGRPNACAVTPYTADEVVVVSSTLALIDKASAVRRDDRVALLANGVALSGHASVGVDLTAAWFDRHLRRQELAKYPPARSILSLPGHRRLFAWYLGRVVISITPAQVAMRAGDDRTTITVIDSDSAIQSFPIPRPETIDAAEIDMDASIPDGPAVVLIHEENSAMTDLRQLTLHGHVASGRFVVDRRHGSLDGAPSGLLDQLALTRQLARRAKANGEHLRGWPVLGA